MIKKILLHKQKGSGTSNLLIGTMLLLLIICMMIHESTYQRNVMAASFVDDSLSSSLLGAVLANPDEYGSSNQLIIYGKLSDYETSDESYNDYVEAIYLTDTELPYYGTYLFEDTDQLTSLGNLKSETVTGEYGPIQSFKTFEKLLKTNMNLDSDWVPKKSIYLPSKNTNGTPNKINVDIYKVYNYIEFMVKHEDWDDPLIKTMPVVNTSGTKVNTCDSSGNPIFESYEELKENNLIYNKVICYTISYNGGSPVITDIEEFGVNEQVYVTDDNGDLVKGKDGENILVNATALYSKIDFNINLGVRFLNESSVHTRVFEEQTVFIEVNRDALKLSGGS